MFFKIDVLKNFASFTENHLYWSLFFKKFAGPATLLKTDSSTIIFQLNCFLRTSYFTEHLRWLLLTVNCYFQKFHLRYVGQGSEHASVLHLL